MRNKKGIFHFIVTSIFFGSSFAMIHSVQGLETRFTPETNDSTQIYFDKDILPIFQSKCATSKCHDTKTAKDGVMLNSYSNTMKTLNLSETTNPLRNKLRGVISRNKMPPIKHEPLTDEEKKLVYSWLEQGMKKEP